jgi:hypothetical protein
MSISKSIYHKKWYAKNRERKLRQNEEWRKNNRERVNRAARKRYCFHRTKNLQRMKKWRQENPSKHYLSCLNWRKASSLNTKKANAYANKSYHKHREKRIRHQIEYHRKRIKNDPSYALKICLRTRMRDALRSAASIKQASVKTLIGCSAQDFKQHIELLFLPNMSWDNRAKWHIDHSKPISSFDLTTEAGQKAAFHYTNCQPLWARDNLRKGAKIL